ncbi:uncharacterized protein A1O9_10438 [Exophiala aquamarina CBS 119918]|uniref:Uncharacterized protein n=1 Tax=Exophiala aquamarina CBS 119918 TaxID=1182545 RepID=A0A072P2F2_9EURO|nr:uncharacterized protein A1O9_10438 [Exophiala aquamarina CBS 119918]KEF53463.1 hypothetical protein A1O9_10438 [Exophiala aquamarina CBS 119918]
MAEVLGLVSGVLTIAQIAGSVGASVIRLKTLWDNVKIVPDSIQSLILQLELLDPIHSEMENQFPGIQTLLSTDRLMMLSFEHSRRAMRTLERLVDDLHHQISSTKRLRKGIAKVKVTPKKELIRTSLGRTLLHYASLEGHFEMLQGLCELGLVVHETDNAGKIPLDYLTRYRTDPSKALDIY